MYLDDEGIRILEQRFHEDDFEEYLESLLDADMIEGDTARGIATKVLNEGYDSLSENQKRSFIFYAIKPNYYSECDRCTSSIPWCEMINALEDGYCGYCSHMAEKN